jgi:ATP-dependent DNA ligase
MAALTPRVWADQSRMCQASPRQCSHALCSGAESRDEEHQGDRNRRLRFQLDAADQGAQIGQDLLVELGPESVVSRRASSFYCAGPSKNWLETKNMMESESVLVRTEIGDSGIPWALLARQRDRELEFAGPAILRHPSRARAQWAEKFAAMSVEKPPLRGLRRANRAQWFKPEIRVRAQHLKAKGTLRHATVKALIEH